MTSSEMGKKGGKSRWRGKTAKQRSDEMRRVARARWSAEDATFTVKGLNAKIYPAVKVNITPL
jgi:hypothetical protein